MLATAVHSLTLLAPRRPDFEFNRDDVLAVMLLLLALFAVSAILLSVPGDSAAAVALLS
jgi:hypothetical protein